MYAPVPAASRCINGHAGPWTATTFRQHAVRLSWRRASSRSNARPTTSKAGRQNVASGQGPQEFLTVASKDSPFKDVEAAILRDLYHHGQEETLPSGHKLAEEGVLPTACYILLRSCFLRKNGEGKLSLYLHAHLDEATFHQHLAHVMLVQ